MAELLEKVERRLWTATTGSSHPNYRQALWRPKQYRMEGVALSDEYAGDVRASRWNRRSWSSLGVLAVRNNALERLEHEFPDSRPAVAFTMGERVITGALASLDDIGSMRLDGTECRVHGFRIGPGDTRFGIGILAGTDTFITPCHDDLVPLGPLPINVIDEPDSAFARMNFS